MIRVSIILVVLICSLRTACAQDTISMKLGGYPVKGLVEHGDTVLISQLDEVVIQPPHRAPSMRDLRQYWRLVYNVKKVYPYAKLAGEKFAEVNAHLQTLKTKKEQRQYIKQVEKDILVQYEDQLKDLTITQGRILIKLIDRETNETSYDVVKELRGSFQAALWQTIARIFGSNLKVEFDAKGEDKMIDEIMVMIEKGQI
jgi:uncharacterized ubiquitin-like protein YukD